MVFLRVPPEKRVEILFADLLRISFDNNLKICTLQIFLQRAGKMLMNSLLFAVLVVPNLAKKK